MLATANPKVDYLSSSAVDFKFAKFLDYNSRPSALQSHHSHVMGELQERDRAHESSPYHRHTDNSSPVGKITRMDSPSSESMDSVVESCHVNNRKRRRGVIEKRRRDRINNSLAELRRLVPSAFEKQGSTKLEKAEILQMTVDHLKTIHAKGLNWDPNGIDPHSMGFQECAAEVARFLNTHEGLNSQDPIRSRLISHLQCYSAQRETFKQTNNWHHSQYPTGPTGLVPPPPPPGITGSSLFSSHGHDPHVNTNVMASQISTMASMSLPVPSCLGTSGMAYTSAPSSSFSAAASFSQSGQYPSFTGSSTMQYMNGAGSQAGYPSTRPHRPWGAELVY